MHVWCQFYVVLLHPKLSSTVWDISSYMRNILKQLILLSLHRLINGKFIWDTTSQLGFFYKLSYLEKCLEVREMSVWHFLLVRQPETNPECLQISFYSSSKRDLAITFKYQLYQSELGASRGNLHHLSNYPILSTTWLL